MSEYARNYKTYKLACLGACGVGKTSLTIMLISNHFVEEYDPTIEDSYRQQVVIDEESCLMEILDTAPGEVDCLRDPFTRDQQGFLLIYSMTSRRSFEEIMGYHDLVLRVKEMVNVPMMLVGNKSDLEEDRVVSRQEGQDAAHFFGIDFIETSAKTRVNVEDAFYSVVRMIRAEEGPPVRQGKCGIM